jgi:hypothetical protein
MIRKTLDKKMTIIELGDGDVVVQRGTHHHSNEPIIVFRSAKSAGEIGAFAQDENIKKARHSIKIVIKNKASLDVLEWAIQNARDVLEEDGR